MWNHLRKSLCNCGGVYTNGLITYKSLSIEYPRGNFSASFVKKQCKNYVLPYKEVWDHIHLMLERCTHRSLPKPKSSSANCPSIAKLSLVRSSPAARMVSVFKRLLSYKQTSLLISEYSWHVVLSVDF